VTEKRVDDLKMLKINATKNDKGNSKIRITMFLTLTAIFTVNTPFIQPMK